jgi:capsule polysaccharide export protein KpsC/LpsZ
MHQKLLKNFRNKLFYNKISSNFNIKETEKFILFLDSYQPEAISNPLQYEFENHILIIENLVAKLPDDYVLVYKEHPGIFMKLGEGYLFRNQTYYKRLKSLGKIIFAPFKYNTYDLIDNSEAVATSGGTGGWEALIRGKKVISFGNSWYNECKGAFKILKSKDIDYAMDTILQKKNNPDLDDVRMYAYSIFQNTFNFDDKILPNTNYEQDFKIDKTVLGDLADYFYKSYLTNYKNK